MTAKEAIENLKAILKEATETEDAVSYVTSVDAESLNLAIEALKKQPEHSQNTPQKQPDLEKFGVKTGETCADVINRQAAIDAIANCTNCGDEKTLRAYVQKHNLDNGWTGGVLEAIDAIEDLPSAQSDIIRCNACKHWTQTTGNMPGFGLGDCDYLNAKLVSCNGFCYWAERRTNA